MKRLSAYLFPQLRYRTKVNTGKTSWLNARPVPDVCLKKTTWSLLCNIIDRPNYAFILRRQRCVYDSVQGLPKDRKPTQCAYLDRLHWLCTTWFYWFSLLLFFESGYLIQKMEEVEEKEDKPNFFRRMSVRLSKRNKKKSAGRFEEITK